MSSPASEWSTNSSDLNAMVYCVSRGKACAKRHTAAKGLKSSMGGKSTSNPAFRYRKRLKAIIRVKGGRIERYSLSLLSRMLENC